MEVNLLVPDESLREVDKLDAKRRGITIAEAKVHQVFAIQLNGCTSLQTTWLQTW